MIKSIKYSVLLAVVGSLLLTGCDDLFDAGDTDQAYDGPDQVAFELLQNEITEGESQEITVQYISSEGEASSDVSVSLGVTADGISSDSYSVSSTSVTIPSGSTSASITVDTSDDPDLGEGEEATIELTIDSADGAEVATNLSASTVFVAGS